MNENLADEIRKTIDNVKDMKRQASGINNYLSILEGLIRADYQKQVDEAYQRGYDKGYADKANNVEVCNKVVKDIQDEAYQRGFEDGKAVHDKGCEGCKYANVAGTHEPCVRCSNSYGNQWTAKDDKIEVGDEVVWTEDENIVIIVTLIYTSNGIEWCDGVCRDGKAFQILTEHARKTGRRFDISKILEAMRT